MHASTHPDLRLTRCPKCDYDISQLPAAHRCPECGFEYDEKMLLLEGWRVPGLGNSRQLLIFAGVSGLLLMMCRGWFGWSWSILGLIFVSLAALLWALKMYVKYRDQSGSRALARWIVTEDGVARFGGRVHPWREYTHLMLLREGADGWRLHLYPSLWWIGGGAPIVNARLDCGDREAEAVRDVIQYRINVARRKDAEAAAKERGDDRSWWSKL